MSTLKNLVINTLRTTRLLSSTSYDQDYDKSGDPHCGQNLHSCSGYQPEIAIIDNLPVYIEGRNGNSQPTFEGDNLPK